MIETLGLLASMDIRRPRRLVAALAAAWLVAGALPAAARPSAGSDGDDRKRTERRVVVVSADDAKGPTVRTRLLGGGFLGVELTPLTPELRAHFGVPADRGVLVARVEEDSPAARAGIQVGDVIAAVDGEAVETPWDLSTAVRSHEAGQDADLVVWRDGRALDFRVTLEERERRQIDVSRLLEVPSGEGARGFRWRAEYGEGEPSTLYVAPESIERLQKALDGVDWPRFEGKLLTERNRELEARLRELEERLQELEEALRRSER